MSLPDIARYPEIAYDTETTGLRPEAGDRVFGFSISTPQEDHYSDIRENPEAINEFNRKIEGYSGDIICHNLSFDYRSSKFSGLNFRLNNAKDTAILACLINEHEHSYSLDNLARKYTSSHKKGEALYEELAKLFGGRATKNVQVKNMPAAPSSIIAPYAMGDTRAAFDLYQYQKKQIVAQDLERIVEFEKKLTPIIIETQMHGIRVDIEAAERAVVVLSEEISTLEKKLNDQAKFNVNVDSQADIKRLFKPEWREGRWWASDGTPLPSTDGGAPSFAADALRTLKDPIAKMILELRSLIKTRDTFLVGHVLESAHNGRVYPSINQNKGEDGGTGTGRLSYSEPALQQIPDRNKRVAEIVKSVFLPDEGHSWVDMDMASFEVRIFAHLVGTADICRAYLDNPETDFHQFVADLTGLVRNATYSGQPNAKQLNLSMIFNQGDGTTAEEMGLPWSWETFTPKNSYDEVTYKKPGPEAKAIIEKYHAALPGVKKLANGCKAVAEKRGYIFTRYGRHLRFPSKHKSYKASGLLIQSTSADENKMNWIIIHEALKGTGARMLINTHDSYSLSIPIGKEEEIARKVKEAVEQDRGLRVPLILEVSHPGKNWWESKSSKRWM